MSAHGGTSTAATAGGAPSKAAAEGDAGAAGGAPSAAADAGPPAFVVPDSPPGELNPRTMDKYLGYVAAAKEGNKINDHIRHSKKFRNPCLLDKLVAYLGVHEFGTNYPPSLYDPNELSKEEHYDRLEEARRRWEERQARKQGEKVNFSSGGMLDASAAAAAPRKSKWGDAGASTDPAAKRPAV